MLCHCYVWDQMSLEVIAVIAVLGLLGSQLLRLPHCKHPGTEGDTAVSKDLRTSSCCRIMHLLSQIFQHCYQEICLRHWRLQHPNTLQGASPQITTCPVSWPYFFLMTLLRLWYTSAPWQTALRSTCKSTTGTWYEYG